MPSHESSEMISGPSVKPEETDSVVAELLEESLELLLELLLELPLEQAVTTIDIARAIASNPAADFFISNLPP